MTSLGSDMTLEVFENFIRMTHYRVDMYGDYNNEVVAI